MGGKFTLGSSENLPGKQMLRGGMSDTASKNLVDRLKKQGYKCKREKLLGSWEVWVEPRYFKKHPKAKGATLK